MVVGPVSPDRAREAEMRTWSGSSRSAGKGFVGEPTKEGDDKARKAEQGIVVLQGGLDLLLIIYPMLDGHEAGA